MPERIDLYQAEVRANPYITYAKMRSDDPVCQVDPGGLWAITRYEDVKAALKNHQAFSSTGFKFIFNPPWFSGHIVGESMLAADPPEHTRLRSLVNKAFTPRVIGSLANSMERVAAQRTEAIRGESSIELLEDFAYPYISEIIGKIVGFAPEMYHDIKHWLDMLAYLGPEKPDEAIYRELTVINDKICGYSERVIQERRHELRDDLISTVMAAEVDGERLTDRECLAMLELLVAAGFDTTVNLTTNCIRQLSQMPSLVDTLYREPELIPAFIEEVMRFDPPTHALLRQTTRDVEVAGVTIPEGEFAYLMLGSAGRDDRHYKNADTFDIYRTDTDHLSFGYGIHVCIGMMLARMEVKIALKQLVTTFSHLLCPEPDQIEWSPALAARGVVQLPVELVLR